MTLHRWINPSMGHGTVYTKQYAVYNICRPQHESIFYSAFARIRTRDLLLQHGKSFTNDALDRLAIGPGYCCYCCCLKFFICL